MLQMLQMVQSSVALQSGRRGAPEYWRVFCTMFDIQNCPCATTTPTTATAKVMMCIVRLACTAKTSWREEQRPSRSRISAVHALSLRAHCALFLISCIFITMKPASLRLLNKPGWPRRSSNEYPDGTGGKKKKKKRAGQSSSVSAPKVATKMWNEYEDKWHANPFPPGNIPTLHIIYIPCLRFRSSSACVPLSPPLISCVYEERHLTFSSNRVFCWHSVYTMCNRCSCLFANAHAGKTSDRSVSLARARRRDDVKRGLFL